LAAILLAFAASRATALAQQDDTALFVRWAREHATPIAGVEVGHQAGDLKSLKSAIGKTQVVALGENAHGVHELLEFRNRLFEFLVQEMGFTAIAVETGFAESMPANDFVSGGAGTSSQLAHNVFQWLPGAFDENRELIEWMRAYNERPSTHRKIRLYGIDLTGGFLGAMNSQAALEVPLAYLDQADPVSAKQLRGRLEPLLDRFSDSGYSTLTVTERDVLTGAIADTVALFERRQFEFLSALPEASYAMAYHEAEVARQVDSRFRSGVGAAPCPASSPTPCPWGRDQSMERDAAMAQNFRWVLAREGADGRVLLFAHSFHVRKATPSEGPMPGKPYSPMGAYLHSALGDSMVVLGLTFREAQGDFGPLGKFSAADPRSLDGILAQLHLEAFALDLRTRLKPAAVERLLNSQMKMRSNDRYDVASPAEAFDVLLFLDRVTPVHRGVN